MTRPSGLPWRRNQLSLLLIKYKKYTVLLMLWAILALVGAFSTAAFAPRPYFGVATKVRVAAAPVLLASSSSPRSLPQVIATASALSRKTRRRQCSCIILNSSSGSSRNSEANDLESETAPAAMAAGTGVDSFSLPTSTSIDNATPPATTPVKKTPIRFLGKGPNAIVREGAVLLAPSHEFHHFYRQAAIFIYSISTDPTADNNNHNHDNKNNNNTNNDDSTSNTVFIRGLILDHPTAFTINDVLVVGESGSGGSDNGHNDEGDGRHNDRFVGTEFGNINLVHRGGDKGGDGLILLHNVKCIAAAAATATAATTDEKDTAEEDDVDDDDDDGMMIGTSGLYQGGWDQVVPACERGVATIANFKAFFNYCEFTEQELDDLLRSDEDGDGWISIEVLDNRLLLSQEWRRGDCWRRLRNAVREYHQHHPTATAAAAAAAATSQ